MTPQNFGEIMGLIQNDITKANTNMHDSITYFVVVFINYRVDIP